jgi:hypothetical protein
VYRFSWTPHKDDLNFIPELCKMINGSATRCSVFLLTIDLKGGKQWTLLK